DYNSEKSGAQITNPNAECTVYCILTCPLPRIHDFPTKIVAGVPNIPPKGQLNGSTINVTYGSVNDLACCEWYFLSPALPFQEDVAGEESRATVIVTIGIRTFENIRQARLRFDSYETVARKPFSMSLCLSHHKCGRTRKLTISPYSARVDRPLVYDTEAPRTTPRRGQLPEPPSMGYAFDDGPNHTHITISRPRSRKRQRSTSEVVFSTGRLRRSALMRTAINSSCFCKVAMIEHDLMSLSPVTAFQSQDAFAELWYSIKALRLVTVVTPTCSRPPYGDVDVHPAFPQLFEYSDINLTFSVVIGPHTLYCKLTGPADYRLEV
ncbi:hypothetical protein BGY98DRAFT_940073, partial [Russula aff. rugulosa BPL654]